MQIIKERLSRIATCTTVWYRSGVFKVRNRAKSNEKGDGSPLMCAGNMDTRIALRTIVIQADKAYIQAGAGIVADSVPAAEWNETLNKAKGLLKAIELTEARV